MRSFFRAVDETVLHPQHYVRSIGNGGIVRYDYNAPPLLVRQLLKYLDDVPAVGAVKVSLLYTTDAADA